MTSVEESNSSYLHCPHCTSKLDIRLLPHFVDSFKHESNFVVIPDEAGDWIKDKFFLMANTNAESEASKMSMTLKDVKKPKSQAPIGQAVITKPKLVAQTQHIPAKSRTSKFQFEKRSFGKNTIFRLPGKGAGNSTNARARNFTTVPADDNDNVQIPRSPPTTNIGRQHLQHCRLTLQALQHTYAVTPKTHKLLQFYAVVTRPLPSLCVII